jgi:copper transport protein
VIPTGWRAAWRRVLGLVATAAACALFVVGPAGPAAAHATLVGSDPAEGAVLAAAPEEAVLTFDETVSLPPDGVQVFDAEGEPVDASAAARDAEVTVDLPDEMPEGTYVVAWRVVSADGHPVAGSLAFSVGRPSLTVRAPAVPEPGAGGVTGTLSGLHGLGYLGLFLAAGPALFATLLLPPGVRLDVARARLRRLVRGAAGVAALAAVVALPVTVAYQQGTGLSAFLEPATWTDVSGAELAVLLTLTSGLALVAVLLGDTPPAGRTRLAVLAGAGLAVVSPALAGHSRAYEPQAPVIALDVLHVLAGSVWLGGLVGLALTLPALAGRGRSAVEVLARFSTTAAGVLVALLATGSLLAWRILGSWEALFGTTYGRLLLAKATVVGIAVAIAAWNRFVLLPRTRATAGHGDRRAAAVRIGRVVGVEAACLVGTILLTGFLVNTSPRDAAPVVPDGRTGVQVAGLGEVRVLAVMTPREVGRNTILLQLQDGSGEPFEPARLPEVSVGSGSVDLGKVAVTSFDTGTYRVDLVLPAGGQWEVRVGLRTSRFDNPVSTLTFSVPGR